jgi:hypothetical protein
MDQGLMELLHRLKSANEKRLNLTRKQFGDEVANTMDQRLEPAEPIGDKGIPTLGPGIYRTPTLMLETRFAFASAWWNAIHGHHWLSPNQMERAWVDERLKAMVKCTCDNWEGSPPSVYPLQQLTLFGLEPYQGEEIYLIWPESGFLEPEVCSYISNYEMRFPNLKEFIHDCCSQD